MPLLLTRTASTRVALRLREGVYHGIHVILQQSARVRVRACVVAAARTSTGKDACPTTGDSISRSLLLRAAFPTAAAAAFGLLHPRPLPAHAVGVPRSTEYSEPAVLTVRNDGKRLVKVYWLNYDGDQELFAYVEPSSSWTVDTFSTHPWRVADAETGVVLKEVVAAAGSQTVEVTGREKPLRLTDTAFDGFDGVGGSKSDYVEATVGTLYVAYDGGAVTLDLEGFQYPVEIPLPAGQLVGLVEAAAGEMRRPSLLQSWQRTLLAADVTVERVIVTRVVPPFFYSRIVLRLPSDTHMSIDSQPGDSIALAQQTGAPLYVANNIASLVNRLVEEAKQQPPDALGSMVPGAPRKAPLLPKGPAVPADLPGLNDLRTRPAPLPGRPAPAPGYSAPFASLDMVSGSRALQL